MSIIPKARVKKPITTLKLELANLTPEQQTLFNEAAVKAKLTTNQRVTYLKAVRAQRELASSMMYDYRAAHGALEYPGNVPIPVGYVQSSTERFNAAYQLALRQATKEGFYRDRGERTKEALKKSAIKLFGNDFSSAIIDQMDELKVGSLSTSNLDDLFDIFDDSYPNDADELYEEQLSFEYQISKFIPPKPDAKEETDGTE